MTINKKRYMQYICKHCECIYLDEDTKGSMKPVKGFYCPDCIEKYGFTNPENPIKRKLSEKQLDTLKKGREVARKNRLLRQELKKEDN